MDINIDINERQIALLILNRATEGGGGKYLEKLEPHTPEELIRSSALCETLGLSEAAKAVIAQSVASAWAHYEAEMCAKKGAHLIFVGEDDYPDGLMSLPSPPLVLYVKGNLPRLGFERNISVVGTRKPSGYGSNTAFQIGQWIAKAGSCTVSGGAQGIDGRAHEGCLSCGGASIAVFGTGIDVTYPVSHEGLFQRIEQGGGCLISEYPLGTGGQAWRFPQRNRIVAAISSRVAVVEAPRKSGAMITAHIAMEIGREVWAVPGRIDEQICEGSNNLIFDGAYPLINKEVFLSSFLSASDNSYNRQASQVNLFLNQAQKIQGEQSEQKIEKNKGEEDIISLLCKEGNRTVDNIASECRMNAAEALKSLSILQARGLIYISGTGRYSAALRD